MKGAPRTGTAQAWRVAETFWAIAKNRRRFLSALPMVGAALLIGEALRPNPVRAAVGAKGLDIDAILDDPDAPVAGNPDGDVTIIAFVDTNCPFCNRSDPDLHRLVAQNGKIRLVTKDWPILAPSSVAGARLALVAKYQGQHEAAHAAPMGLHGRASESAMRNAIAAVGVDMARLDCDLADHDPAIMGLIRRNGAQVDALHLKGAPVYLIGPYLVAAALDCDGFNEIVAKFRTEIEK